MQTGTVRPGRPSVPHPAVPPRSLPNLLGVDGLDEPHEEGPVREDRAFFLT